SFVMGIPGSDDIMLNYQTTSFHDSLYVRRVLGSRPAPEFEQWLTRMQILRDADRHILHEALPEPFARSLKALPGGRA
ncbi:MAG: ethanolamine ammonia-lyase subunit EutB, partial [Pseudomonas neustonica]